MEKTLLLFFNFLNPTFQARLLVVTSLFHIANLINTLSSVPLCGRLFNWIIGPRIVRPPKTPRDDKPFNINNWELIESILTVSWSFVFGGVSFYTELHNCRSTSKCCNIKLAVWLNQSQNTVDYNFKIISRNIQAWLQTCPGSMAYPGG